MSADQRDKDRLKLCVAHVTFGKKSSIKFNASFEQKS